MAIHQRPADRARALRAAEQRLAVPIFACSLFVFIDGRFAPQLSAPRALSGDVRVESLAELRRENPERLEPFLARAVETKQHPFAALNTAFLDDGAVLIVPPGVQVERPMHVVFLTSGEPATVCHPRVLVVAGANSRFSVVQDHVSLADTQGFTNAVTEVFVESGAAGDLVLLQRENPQQLHTSNLSVRLERDARLTTHTVSLGAALLRNDLGVALTGEGADCTANGLFVGGDQQLIDNHTLVDHAVPLGTSRELYKGVLTGSAKGVFRGRVIVRPDAQRTNAVQSNPNLLLSDAAEIDTKPQLEIHADDVKCSHGSAIGRLDDDALFYLRTRGIGEPRAREILSRGFASEVTRTISIEPLSQEIDRLVAEKLDS
jgi:Fe-S cluster assembly protein SufD